MRGVLENEGIDIDMLMRGYAQNMKGSVTRNNV